MRPLRRPARLGMALALALATAGCSASADRTTTSPKAAGAATTVESCGRDLAFDAPPQRAVTLDQSSTEVLLALGLEDRMAGTSNLKTRIAGEHRDAYRDVPVLSDELLTAEQLRAATPDLVVAGFADQFTKDRVGTRRELAELGLPGYVSAVDCPRHGEPGASPFDLLFSDYRALGRIFGVQGRAAKLVDAQREVLDRAARAAKDVRGEPTVVWIYSVYGDTPYVAGGGAMPTEMSRIAGAKNAFADIDEDWPAVSWEQVAQRNPDFLVIGDLSERGTPGDSAEEKLAAMRAHPVVSEMEALRENRVIEIPGTEMDPSVRAVDALPRLTEGMKELGYAR